MGIWYYTCVDTDVPILHVFLYNIHPLTVETVYTDCEYELTNNTPTQFIGNTQRIHIVFFVHISYELNRCIIG